MSERDKSVLEFNPLSAQINPECVPRLSLKMYIFLLAWLDSKGQNKSHDCGLTHLIEGWGLVQNDKVFHERKSHCDLGMDLVPNLS